MKLIMQENDNKIIEVFGDAYNKHVIAVAKDLRAADFDEAFVSSGESPHLSIIEDWDMSPRRWIILNKNDIAVAVLGVRPTSAYSPVGIPWLLGTRGLDKMKKFFVKYSKPIIEEMKIGYKLLLNFVDARYIKAVRWLEWCGFTIDEPVPFGALQMPFHRFYMEIN